MSMGLEWKNGDHELCMIDEVSKLMERGFTCYIEEELQIGPSKTNREYKAVVDIYAVRKSEEILIEIGTLSVAHGDRLILLKQLKPNAMIIHIHQWKNYGITNSYMEYLYFEEMRRKNFDPIEAIHKIAGLLE